ncbi:MAG: hypothetical protein R2706_05945 [Acidimicrobiales bacterium]
MGIRSDPGREARRSRRARLAAVNYQPTSNNGETQTAELIAEICNRLETPDAGRVLLSWTSDGSAGSLATIRVERDLDQLTGFFSFLDDFTPASEIEFRLERSATWSQTTGEVECPAP